MLMSRGLATLVVISLVSAHVPAQWTSDPALNLAVADSASDQSQPKLEATTDGSVYLSWFDGIGSGYDVRVQRLDAAGNEAWAHNGVLVADRGFSSTQDYGLSLSAGGDALLAFRDDRPGGTQISAARVASDGSQPWGPLGVQLTATGSFVAAPKIAGTADGGAVVAWTQDANVRLQRLDASGTKQWPGDVVLTPPGGSYSVADLHAFGNRVILSAVHQTGGFGSPRRLITQSYDSAGAPLWGAAPVPVFDTGSLQFGNFPAFAPDGSGGAVFSWYTSSPLQCWAQRILSNGSEAFAHNGVAVSTNGAQIRVNPWASFDDSTGSTLVSWVEQNSLQSQFGLGSQKLDASGNRLWGSQGVTHIALGSTEIGSVRNQVSADGLFVSWIAAPAFAQDVLLARRLAADGSTDVGPFSVASTVSHKLRPALTATSAGQLVLAWTDARNDSGDVYAQNLNCDGSLGPPSTSAAWTDLGQGLAGLQGVPQLSGAGTLCPGDAFSVTLGAARPDSSAALLLGLSLLSLPLKGGVLVPNPDVIVFGLPTGPFGILAIDSTWPSNLPSGLSLFLQYWITDAAGPLGFSASNGLHALTP